MLCLSGVSGEQHRQLSIRPGLPAVTQGASQHSPSGPGTSSGPEASVVRRSLGYGEDVHRSPVAAALPALDLDRLVSYLYRIVVTPLYVVVDP